MQRVAAQDLAQRLFGEHADPKTSHGCVNLSPADAKWMFNWVTPQLQRPDQAYVHLQPGNLGTWVYVYSSAS